MGILHRASPKAGARGVLAALRAIDDSPWTRDWDHLAPVTHVIVKRAKVLHTDLPEAVPVRDRIRQWNIVPGDRIRVRGDESGVIREVFGVNKYRNLVYFKARQLKDVTESNPNPPPPSVPYSKCQLYIGEHEFPPLPGETKPLVTPVFATRISCTAPKWAADLHCFDWKRFAAQTFPRLGERGEKIKIHIPWPEAIEPPVPPMAAYDTPADVVNEITWRPSTLFYPPSNRSQAKTLQDAYLHSVRPPLGSLPAVEYDQVSSPAIEYTLGRELSNPHSRAKKQRRARDRIKARRVAHDRFLQTELANLDGRTRKDALTEAEWKWKELCRKADQELRKKQWVLRGGAERLERRRQRRERKERREVEKMKNLLLDPARNQILPGSQPVAQL